MSLNKIVFIVFTAALVFCGCSQWAGKPVTKEFSVGNRYTELQVKNAFDIIVSDTVSNIIVSAGENVMPKVVVENNDGK